MDLIGIVTPKAHALKIYSSGCSSAELWLGHVVHMCSRMNPLKSSSAASWTK